MQATATRYVRKRGTKEIFAYEERLMMRGDMVMYDGPIPVPGSFTVPKAEIDMMEVMKQIKAGNLEPGMRMKTGGYLRKMGTKEVFTATPSLIQRGDMVPYYGMVPVPPDFIVPPDEIEMLIFLGKMKAPELEPKPAEVLEAPPLEKDTVQDTTIPEPTNRQLKIDRIIDAIGKMNPDDFSPRTKKPDARVISTMIGELVVKDERDEAWDKIQMAAGATSEGITSAEGEPATQPIEMLGQGDIPIAIQGEP